MCDMLHDANYMTSYMTHSVAPGPGYPEHTANMSACSAGVLQGFCVEVAGFWQIKSAQDMATGVNSIPITEKQQFYALCRQKVHKNEINWVK